MLKYSRRKTPCAFALWFVLLGPFIEEMGDGIRTKVSCQGFARDCANLGWPFITRKIPFRKMNEHACWSMLVGACLLLHDAIDVNQIIIVG